MKKAKALQKIITPFLVIFIIVCATVLIIFYGRGYRLDLKQKSVGVKGLLVTNSQPNGAQVFINSKLTTATNATLTLDPGWYQVRLEKEGYSSWEKNLRIQGEVVAKTDAILFPINPSLSPLTITGVANPKLSPDNTKIVFSVSKSNTKVQNAIDGGGIFILDLSDKPLGATRNTRQIARDTPLLSFSNATLSWDPESKKVLAEVDNRYFLLDTDSLNTSPLEVTSMMKTLADEWVKTENTLEKERLKSLKKELAEILQQSTSIISWSPDETKILYEATASATIPQIVKPALIGTNPTKEERTIKPDQIYVYDIKEDKNFFIMEKKKIPTPTPSPVELSRRKVGIPTSDALVGGASGKIETSPLIWFPTSSHLLLTEEGKISIMDYDATNKITLYAGPFIGDLIAPWPNGSKIVILTSLNPQPDAEPNLYAINIR